MKKLRIIPQRMPHDDLIIEGNTEGIKHLISLLTRSIEANETATTVYTGKENTFSPPDGEGYHVMVKTSETWPGAAIDHYYA